MTCELSVNINDYTRTKQAITGSFLRLDKLNCVEKLNLNELYKTL